jgi:hypothetical protein
MAIPIKDGHTIKEVMLFNGPGQVPINYRGSGTI